MSKGSTGFWSSVNYVHDDISQHYPDGKWIKESYPTNDKAGLFFTIILAAFSSASIYVIFEQARSFSLDLKGMYHMRRPLLL